MWETPQFVFSVVLRSGGWDAGDRLVKDSKSKREMIRDKDGL